MAIHIANDTICGFCSSGKHENCAISTKHEGRHEKYKQGVVWTCRCRDGACIDRSRRKCANCGNKVEHEVSAETFTCIDIEGCKDLVEQRHAADPLLAKLREAKERADMAKVEDNKQKAEKAAKTKEPTYCLVTGEPTKGGLFKPGMDARYVSDLVAAVTSKNSTEKQARDKMKKDGVSERLVAKFDKSLALAREREQKKADAAKEKAAAKGK